MSKHADLGTAILDALKGRYTLEKLDIGTDARLSKSGMVFETESYAVKDLGHLCVLRMKAFLGLMKMETVVLAVKERTCPSSIWTGSAPPGKRPCSPSSTTPSCSPCRKRRWGAFRP